MTMGVTLNTSHNKMPDKYHAKQLVSLSFASRAHRSLCPLESIRCEANIVFISVDFLRPICPRNEMVDVIQLENLEQASQTNDNNIKLEAALQELMLNLAGDGVKPNVGGCTNLFSCRRHGMLLEKRQKLREARCSREARHGQEARRSREAQR